MHAASGTIPQIAMPARAPYAAVSAPMIGAPTGVPPAKTSMYRPITRPRTAGSTQDWTDAFAIAWNARLATPTTISSTRNTAMPGASAAAAWARPKAAAVPSSTRIPGRRTVVATSAPPTEPTAMTMLNSP